MIFLGIKYECLSDTPVIKICEWGPWGCCFPLTRTNFLRGDFLQDRVISSKNAKNLATRRWPVVRAYVTFQVAGNVVLCANCARVAGSARRDEEGKWRSEDFGQLSRFTRCHYMNKLNRNKGNLSEMCM